MTEEEKKFVEENAGKGEEDTLSEFKAQIDEAGDENEDEVGTLPAGAVVNEPNENDEGDEAGETGIPSPPGANVPFQADGVNNNNAELLAEIKSLRTSVETLQKSQSQSAVNKEREEEKVKLSRALHTLNQKYRDALDSGDTAKAVEHNNAMQQITSRAAILDWEEKQEKAKAEAEAKNNKEGSASADIPQEAQKWMQGNQWMNDPRYSQWRQYAEGIAGRYIQQGYDANSPMFYTALENELKANGFKHPDPTKNSNVVPMTGGSKNPTQPTGTAAKGRKSVKLDRERAELAFALELGDNPAELKAYQKIVQARKAKKTAGSKR